MNKGLTPLEALELLKITYGNATYIYIDKNLDLPQPTTLTLRETIIPIIEKELKALEIIKSKDVNVGALRMPLNDYNSYCVPEEYKLTQEEYDLLKEVLVNER